MTRETKIGLLVGLAFIIVVGILLSEHLTATTERPAAPLAQAGEGVREGVATPGVITRETYRPADPVAPVPTAHDLSPRPVQVNIPPANVSVGPGQSGQTPIVINERSGPFVQNNTPHIQIPLPTDNRQPAENPPVQVTQNPEPPIITRTPVDPFANDPRNIAASHFGEQVVPVNNSNPVPVPSTKTREYKAQPGDSLSRIAALLPGGNTKANREAVVKLNPTLQTDPNKVIAGKTYLLPSEGVAPATPVTQITPPLVQQPSTIVRTPEANSSYRTYIVKKGDSLSKIASEQLGSKNQVSVIRELNQDILKNGDVIWIDMKLKLPAKMVAAGE